MTYWVLFTILSMIVIAILVIGIYWLSNLNRCDHRYEYLEEDILGGFPVKECYKCGKRISTKFGD